MKKLLAVLMALVLMMCSVAFADAVNPDDVADTMTSEDGTYKLAFVTDVGQLKDKSFNQGTWNGVKGYAAEHGMSYKYYQPANGDQATDDDRYDAMKAACEGGADVVICAGFMQETALKKAAAEFTDTKFVFVDGYEIGLSNVAPISFKEEQSGYLAGYAVVKDGFTKLGFAGGGGGTNPACCRFGYGFAQGANAAAKEMGINVELKYSWQYGASFSASPELQTGYRAKPSACCLQSSCTYTCDLAKFSGWAAPCGGYPHFAGVYRLLSNSIQQGTAHDGD